jgi:hypothetical protein
VVVQIAGGVNQLVADTVLELDVSLVGDAVSGRRVRVCRSSSQAIWRQRVPIRQPELSRADLSRIILLLHRNHITACFRQEFRFSFARPLQAIRRSFQNMVDHFLNFGVVSSVFQSQLHCILAST